MLVVNFAVNGTDNCVNVAGSRYVFARAQAGSFVLPIRCAHRGGPLHLARFAPGTTRLVCPWHGRATSVTRSLRAGLPAVRRGDRVTVVFPYDERTEYSREYRPLSPDLAVSGPGADPPSPAPAVPRAAQAERKHNHGLA